MILRALFFAEKKLISPHSLPQDPLTELVRIWRHQSCTDFVAGGDVAEGIDSMGELDHIFVPNEPIKIIHPPPEDTKSDPGAEGNCA